LRDAGAGYTQSRTSTVDASALAPLSFQALPKSQMPQSNFVKNKQGLVAATSIGVAIVVMGIKYLAYLVTDSVALFSDALESIVNVLTAIAALIAIRIGSQPPDRRHPFGHHKAEYFSAVLEGALIIVASLLIFREALGAILKPRAIDQPALGLLINFAATIINAAWAWLLINRGRVWSSPALAGDGRHLLSDVVTSFGVLAGLILATLTGWSILDPIIACIVAVNILRIGYNLTKESISQLLDEAASPEIQARIRKAIEANSDGALQAHDIRTRTAGPATFIEFHLVVPGAMTVIAAHQICDQVEAAIESEIAGAQVVIHIEPEHEAKGRGRWNSRWIAILPWVRPEKRRQET